MAGGGDPRLLYEQDQFPVFQNRIYDSEQEARDCPKGTISLVEDRRSGLIHNAAFRAELMAYDANYQNEQALSPAFRAHLREVRDMVGRHLGRRGLVEVGCGKGSFVELLLAGGFDVTGFDPAYEGRNPRIRARPFSPGMGIAASGIILRHVLEHIERPVEFLRQIAQANGGSGKIYIEVPCFDWICRNRAWFDVFYEHVNYFRASDFLRMFGQVWDIGHLFGGQYLFVVAELASLGEPRRRPEEAVLFPADFLRSLTVLDEGAARPAVVWGGASKGVIFCLLRERAGKPVSTVIDINPAKQGGYLPATGLTVQAPAAALPQLPEDAIIYVMNSNYLEEIRQMSGNRFEYVAIDHA